MAWKKFVVSCFALLALVACKQVGFSTSLPNALSVNTPISMSKAGNSVVIDFQATRENVDLDETYMIKLAFDRVPGNDILRKLDGYGPKSLVPLKVVLEQKSSSGWKNVQLIDNSVVFEKLDISQYPEMPPQSVKSHIIHGFVYASQTARGLMVFGRFKFPEFGNYRVTIDTVRDLPIFENIPTYVAVERRYPLGK